VQMKRCSCAAVLLACVVSGVLVDNRAADAAFKRPCVELDLAYGLHTVASGQVFDYAESVVNCSNRMRRIRVRIRAFGPCEFPHPGSAMYLLPAHSGVRADALIVAPQCHGRYRVVAKAIVRGSVVDIAHAGFTVIAR
jgi:hypothetical protein